MSFQRQELIDWANPAGNRWTREIDDAWDWKRIREPAYWFNSHPGSSTRPHYYPQVVSLRQLIYKATGNDAFSQLPAVQLFAFPTNALADTLVKPGIHTSIKNYSEHNGSTHSQAGLDNLPLDLLYMLFAELCLSDRMTLAYLNKTLARAAVHLGIFDAHIGTRPVLAEIPEFPIDVKITYIPSIQKIRKPVHHWRASMKCSRCRCYHGSIGTKFWFWHVAMELERLGTRPTKGVLQAVTYEKLMLLLEKEHEHPMLLEERWALLAAEWFQRTMQNIHQGGGLEFLPYAVRAWDP